MFINTWSFSLGGVNGIFGRFPLNWCTSSSPWQAPIMTRIIIIMIVSEQALGSVGESVATGPVSSQVWAPLTIRLSSISALLTTSNTPFGRYHFKVLPYGLCSVPEILQKGNCKRGDVIDLCIVTCWCSVGTHITSPDVCIMILVTLTLYSILGNNYSDLRTWDTYWIFYPTWSLNKIFKLTLCWSVAL